MDLNKISNFIKTKRKELGITQNELAEKLFVTEKAISRWETGRGTPDISLLLPLSKELNIDVSELLNGEENKKNKNDVEQLIKYNEITKANKYNFNLPLMDRKDTYKENKYKTIKSMNDIIDVLK